MQAAIHDQSLEGNLVAWYELLDEVLPRPVAAGRRSFGLGEDGAQPLTRRSEGLRIVGPHHPTRRRQAHRLQDTRIADGLRERGGIVLQAAEQKTRDGHCGLGEQLALQVLIARRDRGVHGVSLERQPSGDRRRDDCCRVVHPDDTVDRVLRREHPHGIGRALGLFEIEGEKAGEIGPF